jgi:DNA-binding NtrC family response regulator
MELEKSYSLAPQVSFTDIIGKSDSIALALALAKKIANSAIPVLIEGPNGVGKELFARAIHGSSARSGKPFVTVDCESLRSGSADDVLFGSERMLDNGVIEKNVGKVRESNGGTLFLDNVNALKIDTQIKLLRFIQEGEIEPAGSKMIYKASVRIISSTNKSLKLLVDENRFREDLYYRLNIFPIMLPSLRERGAEDIRLLAESFCYNFCISENKKIKGISNESMEILADYEWEDNIRQLKSYIFRAVVLCDDEFIKPEHLPRNVRVKDDKDENKTKRGFGRRGMELIDIFDDDGVCKSLDDIEEEVVRRLVEFYNGNLSEVAKQLKVGRSTVYRKLKMLNQIQDD